MEEFQKRDQEDVGTAEEGSAGKGQTTSRRPCLDFVAWDRGSVFFVWEHVTLTGELGLCVPVKHPGTQ